MTIRSGLDVQPRLMALPSPGRKTASGGLQPWARRRVRRIGSQPTVASGENRPRYDVARRGAVLPQKMEPCSGAQKAGQWLGDNVGKVGSLATNLGLTATTAGGGLFLAGMGQIGRGNFVGGLRTGMLGFIAMEKGAELTGVGGLITAGGGVISAVSGSGKPATVEGLTRLSTSLLPSGPIKDFASEAISKGLDAVIPDIRSCAP
ncbi:putative protein OS=Sphingobium scionense OX=1404341 GN=GGQ90_004439 PE=4 SV=1 [Sphingobium scionense]|uniref:Uncharacterized protein n=1 Tax=Sphingobium scionense TaxID=1404341 RepID=A0A7W6LUY2_9SPHN|nr:hypothetical protein [Sphingobium scionense]